MKYVYVVSSGEHYMGSRVIAVYYNPAVAEDAAKELAFKAFEAARISVSGDMLTYAGKQWSDGSDYISVSRHRLQ
jgi:hypothetical protein